MKLTALLVLLFCLSAAGKVIAQKIDLDVSNERLETVLNELQRQSGYSFIYNAGLLEDANPVSVRIRSGDIREALSAIFAHQPFEYRISEKVITIVPKPGMNDSVRGPQKQSAVRGRVTDSLGNPLQGVTVQIAGTNFHTSTDNNGMYEFRGVPFGAILSFRLLSYEQYEVPVDRQVINVVLRLLRSQLEEVLVERGYYRVSRKLNTGSVNTVGSEALSRQPVSDPIAALQGQIPGLSVVQGTGTPGRSFSVQLRGRNSIANGLDPLYIIDGVPYPSKSLTQAYYLPNSSSMGLISPFNSLNIADIKSITVLKDADATAIYGSMGANGVIIIETKKGVEGSLKIDINTYFGWGNVAGMYDLLDTEQYLTIRKEAFKNDGLEPRTNHYDMNGVWSTSRYTDWQDVLIGNTANSSDIQLRLSGGSRQTLFSLSGGFHKETTVFPGDFFDRKLSLQSNISHQSLNNRIKINMSVGYINNQNLMPTDDPTRGIILAPNAPATHNEDGTLNFEDDTFTSNPIALLKRQNRAATDNYLANGNISYAILEGLQIKGSFGFNHIELDQNIVRPLSSYSPSRSDRSDLRYHNFMNNRLQSWIAEPQIQYNKNFNGGILDILIGATFRGSNQGIIGQVAENFTSDALIRNPMAASSIRIFSYDHLLYRYNAIFGRVGYNWHDRYIINLTGRRDGSSRFGPSNRFGNFGSLGMAWIFSNESFFEPILPVMNFGKIRFSYGSTGNDQLPDYQYLRTYESLNYVYLTNTGLIPSQHHNPEFGWETVRKLEAGIEAGLFDNKLNVVASWYRNRTGNQLVGYPLPTMTGFPSVQANLPAVIQNKGIELEISSSLGRNNGLQWQGSANISFPRDKLLSYPDFEQSNYRNTYALGKSLSGSYRYIFTGLDPNTGLYTFKDFNGDGAITYEDDTEYIPYERKYYGGISNVFTWKSWSLSFLFHFVNQRKEMYYNSTPGSFFSSGYSNMTADVFDRWENAGDIGKKYQRISTTAKNENLLFGSSNGMLVDGSFARLKNLVVSWSAPEQYISKFKVDQLRLYVQCQNLLTITGYDGIDPESSTSLLLPPIRMITCGLNLIL